MHTRGKEKVKEPDFKCNQCGEEFNQLTRSQLSLRTTLSLKGLFERHLWTHKVADFQCNCDNVPVLRPGKATFQWRLKCTSDNFLGEELGMKGQRLSKIFLEKERHMQVMKVFLVFSSQYIHVDILKGWTHGLESMWPMWKIFWKRNHSWNPQRKPLSISCLRPMWFPSNEWQNIDNSQKKRARVETSWVSKMSACGEKRIFSPKPQEECLFTKISMQYLWGNVQENRASHEDNAHSWGGQEVPLQLLWKEIHLQTIFLESRDEHSRETKGVPVSTRMWEQI